MPWQLAQLATVCEPALAARPWKVASKLTTRSGGNPKRLERRMSPWHRAQVSRMCRTCTGEDSLVCGSMECSPWQSVHSGAEGTPRSMAWPWTLALYCWTTSLWHIAQASGTILRNAEEPAYIT